MRHARAPCTLRGPTKRPDKTPPSASLIPLKSSATWGHKESGPLNNLKESNKHHGTGRQAMPHLQKLAVSRLRANQEGTPPALWLEKLRKMVCGLSVGGRRAAHAEPTGDGHATRGGQLLGGYRATGPRGRWLLDLHTVLVLAQLPLDGPQPLRCLGSTAGKNQGGKGCKLMPIQHTDHRMHCRLLSTLRSNSHVPQALRVTWI